MSPRPSAYRRQLRSAADTQPLSRIAIADQTIATPAVAGTDTEAHPVARTAYVPALAWSDEQPDHPVDAAADHAAAESVRALPAYLRPGRLVAAAGSLVAVAAAGLFLTLHGGSPSVAAPTVNSNHSSTPAATPVAQPPTTTNTPPAPTATRTVVVDRTPGVAAKPHHWAVPTVSTTTPPDTPPYTPPTETPHRVEQWWPHRSTLTTFPTWGFHVPTRIRHGDNDHSANSDQNQPK